MATVSNTISDILNSLSTCSDNSKRFNTVTEISEALSTLTYNHFTTIVESLIANIFVNELSIFKTLTTDILAIQDDLRFIFKTIVTEDIVTADNLIAIKGLLQSIVESISLLDSTNSKHVVFESISSLIQILSSLNKELRADVIESLTITNTISTLYKLYSSLLDTLIQADTLIERYSIFYTITEIIDYDESVSSKAIFRNLLSEHFILQIPEILGSDKYLAYLLSPETNSVSTYTNYNFNGCTPFKGKYLFYNRTGLYEYGGELDDTAKIRSELETVAFNFKSSNLKQVPSLYLGVNSTDNFILKVRVDGKAEVIYKLNKYTQNLQTQKIDIGKGLIGRYFQFELMTEASEFDLESIEFYPIELRRKL